VRLDRGAARGVVSRSKADQGVWARRIVDDLEELRCLTRFDLDGASNRPGVLLEAIREDE